MLPLSGRGVEAISIKHDREWIAGETLVGEHATNRRCATFSGYFA